jgi:TonB family protein
VLYSYEDGLVLGDFRKGKPHGECVCYKPNGEVYWGEFKKGKATGNGKIYRDNGIVVAGDYKNGRYHGLDTLYRNDGKMLVCKFRNGKMKGAPKEIQSRKKPEYPKIYLRGRHEDFLKELELMWEERNLAIARKAGLVHPKFQGGGIDDFALWVNSKVQYPESLDLSDGSRTVIVEFTVGTDGTVSEVHAVFGSDTRLNAAAVDAVKQSPKWEPGEHKGVKRSVRMTVPLVFNNE